MEVDLFSSGFIGQKNEISSDRPWDFEVDAKWGGFGEGSSRPWELSDASQSDWWLGLVFDPNASPSSV